MSINKTLFKQTFKSNIVLWIVITGVMALLMVLISGIMGPTIMDMVEKMPSVGGDVSSMAGSSMDNLLGTMFYGNMGILLPMVYVIVTANGLIASQVDRGSLAYTLSTPIKRTSVTFTQIAYLVTALFAMSFTVGLAQVVGYLIAGVTIDLLNVVLLAGGMFLLQLAFGGIAFMASCIFNLSRNSIALGAGVPVFFYIISIVGQLGSDRLVAMGMGSSSLDIFNYFTIISLYNVDAILARDWYIILQFGGLAVLSALCMAIGHVIFKSKDLPL
jgi:ABC-2 type transport system permease protein